MSLPLSSPLFSVPPEGTAPTTIQDAVALLNDLVIGTVLGSYLPYVIGSATPGVDDQNKAWIKLDAAGRPIGTFVFYGGAWRRQYTGKPAELTYFNGDPSFYFDNTGLGLTTAEWDGWALCNGQNGTPNLTDKFIVTAHMDDSGGSDGYTGGVWKSKVSGSNLQSGGNKDVTLGPLYTPLPARDAVIVDRYDAGATRDASGRLFGITGGGATYEYELIPAETEVTAIPFDILPPYYALAIVRFVGYS